MVVLPTPHQPRSPKCTRSSRVSDRVASNATSGGFLGQLTVLASDRSQRMLDAQPRRPGLLWAGLLSGGVVLVALSGFMRLETHVVT